jgi:predicted PurR-regulated permease PerM
MSSVNAPLATSGFLGAITSVLVATVTKFVPDNSLQALIAVTSGTVAALVSFEIMSWLVVIRLKSTQNSLSRILPNFEKIQEQTRLAIEKQKELMTAQNAPAQAMKAIEKEANDLSASIISAMIEINKNLLKSYVALRHREEFAIDKIAIPNFEHLSQGIKRRMQ